jgi:hypothetical protein
LVVGCRNGKDMWQQVGIASSRDRLSQPDRFEEFFPLTKDSTLRLETEILTDGPDALGDGKGGWFVTIKDFVPIKGTPYAPGSAFALATISTVDGPQFESLFQIRILEGNWWIGHNGNWLGYYPGDLFQKAPIPMLQTQACEVDDYGEVSAALDLIAANETWPFTPLGSGQFAEMGYLKASYFRDPTYVATDAAGTWTLQDPNNAIPPPPGDYDPACYTSTPFTAGPPPSELYSYVGGKGDAVGCK